MSAAHFETMTPQGPTAATKLNRLVRTVLVADLVESVRLMDVDENDAVERWESLVRRVETEVLSTRHGRLVKSLGDGFILDFPTVSPGIQSAFAIQKLCGEANTGVPPERKMALRIGIHTTELISGEYDVYGRGVNLAVRLTTLASPGEVVVSSDVRAQLTPFLDATFEDLGECYLKHVPQPVRAYRAGVPGRRSRVGADTPAVPALRPTVAVIPFSARTRDPDQYLLGEILADEIIASISHAPDIDVISRLSTTALRDRSDTLEDARNYLNATYVLSGTYRMIGTHLSVMTELAEARSGRIVWSETYKAPAAEFLNGDDRIVHEIVAAVSSALSKHELRRASTQPLPTLECSTLLMGAVSFMHRGTTRDFERAREMLDAVIDRARLVAAPHAWLAKWHVLRFNRGWSGDQKNAAQLALDSSKRALDLDPNCGLALVIDGFIHTNLLRRLDIAEKRYEGALKLNPSDSLAWLLMGMLQGFRGEGEKAVMSTERAMSLSPLDPIMYFYESLAASAALSAGRYERAIALAESSLRSNRLHTSTLRALAISQSMLGRIDEARRTVEEILAIEPTLTVSKYVARSPASASDLAMRFGDALKVAGLPEA